MGLGPRSDAPHPGSSPGQALTPTLSASKGGEGVSLRPPAILHVDTGMARLGLTARIHGVRYPPHARALLDAHGVEYAGWLPNHRVPDVFAAFRVTVHVPRRPYVAMLPGIPTIRPFEALA